GPPPHLLAEEGSRRYTDDVGEGQAEEHHGHGLSATLCSDEGGGHHCPGSEERAVGESGGEPEQHADLGGGGEGEQGVAGDEHAHHGQQHGLTGQAYRDGGQQRGSHHDAEGVGGDEVAGLGNGDAEVMGDLRQYAHQDEFGRADAEGTDRECEQCDGHKAPSGTRTYKDLGRTNAWGRSTGSDWIDQEPRQKRTIDPAGLIPTSVTTSSLDLSGI